MRGLPEFLSLVDDFYNTFEEEPSKQFPSLPVVFIEERPALRALTRPISRQIARRPCPYSRATPRHEVAKAKDVQDFSIAFDVSSFQPEEISVKVRNRDIIVEAKHEERQDGHGYVSRQFTRRYTLPDEYDLDTVSTFLNADGKMTIKALKPKSLEAKNERIIPIKRVVDNDEEMQESVATTTQEKKKDSIESKKENDSEKQQQQEP